MPEPQTYEVTDPTTGKHVTLQGDSPPTEDELNQIFASVHGTETPAAKPPQSPSWMSLIGTTAGEVAKNVVVAPAAALWDAAKNAYEQEGTGNAAMRSGDYLGAAKAYALENPVTRMINQGGVQPAISEAGKAVQNVQQGRIPEAIAHTAAAALPVVGPFAAQAGEKIGTGDPTTMAEGVGDAITLLAGDKIAGGTLKAAGKTAEAVGKFIPRDTEAASATLMARAARPGANNPGFMEKIPRAMADLKAVEQRTGKPIEDLAGALDAIKTAKKANRQQFDQLKDPQAAAGAVIDGNPIADAIEKSIPKRTELQNPAEAARVRKVAESYRRNIPITEADQLLQEVNADLDSYYQKNPAAKRAQATSNPDTAATAAEATALRTQFYDKLDNPGGGAAAQELQRRYGSLAELERNLLKRKNATMVSGPDQLVESVGKFAAARDIVRAGAKLIGGNLPGAALDVATAISERQVGKYIAEQRTTDALIKRAMAAHKTLPTPIQMPAAALIRGALPAPAIQMPGVAVKEAPEPPMMRQGVWNPDQRLKGLPEPARPMAAAGNGATYSGEGTVPIVQGEIVEPEPPIARRGTWGERWVPTPAQIAAAPASIRGLLERGAIRLGRTAQSVRGRPVPAGQEGPLPLAASKTWQEGPDEWEIMLEQPKPGALSPIELRELERIHSELEAMPFTKKFATDTGAYGQKEWHAGAGGAPVYDDVLDAPDPVGFKKESGVGKPSRSKMAEDIFTAMKGGRISRLAAKAIVVARARAVGSYPEGPFASRLSKPKLPPWWEEEPQP